MRGQPISFIKSHHVKLRMATAPMRGADHPRWNGGRILVKGYSKRLVGVGHPMADGAGYAYEHRLVMAERIGRNLSRDEHVHHIDGERLNNDPTNLAIVSRHDHRRIHHLIDDQGVDPADAVRRIQGENKV